MAQRERVARWEHGAIDFPIGCYAEKGYAEKGLVTSRPPRYNPRMQFFVRAVVTGFAPALGAALYKTVTKELGFDDNRNREAAPPVGPFGVTSA